MSPMLGFSISRLARIRWPMCSVGSIDPLGIRYGLTTNAWIRSASPTATATVITSSISDLTVDLGAFVEDRGISCPPRARARRGSAAFRRSSLLRLFGLRAAFRLLGGALRLGGRLRR